MNDYPTAFGQVADKFCLRKLEELKKQSDLHIKIRQASSHLDEIHAALIKKGMIMKEKEDDSAGEGKTGKGGAVTHGGKNEGKKNGNGNVNNDGGNGSNYGGFFDSIGDMPPWM